MTKSIIEVHHTFNNVSIRLNLHPDQLLQFFDAFARLREAAEAREGYLRMQEREWRHDQLKASRLMGLRTGRLARKTGERIKDIAHILARETGIPEETVIARGRTARQHVNRRYAAIRNTSIRRMAAEGVPYSQISQRFDLSTGRISQIVKQPQPEGVTIQ